MPIMIQIRKNRPVAKRCKVRPTVGKKVLWDIVKLQEKVTDVGQQEKLDP